MGILGDLSFGSIKGLMEGAGSLAKDLRSAITGEISPEKKPSCSKRRTSLRRWE